MKVFLIKWPVVVVCPFQASIDSLLAMHSPCILLFSLTVWSNQSDIVTFPVKMHFITVHVCVHEVWLLNHDTDAVIKFL